MNRSAVCLILAALSSTFACTATTEDDEESSGDAVTTTATIKPEWIGPTPGTKDNDIDGKKVFDAWRKVKETFYDNKGLKAFDAQGNLVDVPQGQYPLAQEAAQCMGNLVPNWSDLAMHFYCWMPSYAVVTPNVRGCFSYVARAARSPAIGRTSRRARLRATHDLLPGDLRLLPLPRVRLRQIQQRSAQAAPRLRHRRDRHQQGCGQEGWRDEVDRRQHRRRAST